MLKHFARGRPRRSDRAVESKVIAFAPTRKPYRTEHLFTHKSGGFTRESSRRIKSFFPYKDRLNRSQKSKVIYKAGCWDCSDFYIGKTKRRLHDRKTEHFRALTKNDPTSAIADHIRATGHNIKWDHFDILASGKTDYHCKIKETLLIQELKSKCDPWSNISWQQLKIKFGPYSQVR